MDEHPVPQPAPDHPFTRALKTWEAWSSADTWTRTIADARAHGRSLTGIGEPEELTRGPHPLEALAANREVVELLIRWQWQAMRAAREQGCSWREIGHALGVGGAEARSTYVTAVERQALAARFMPELGPLLRYDPRWRELADETGTGDER